MKNFEFYNPVKVLFGKGQIDSVKNEINTSSKVLVLYGGGSIKKNGVYDQVMNTLKEHKVFEYSAKMSKPCFERLLDYLYLLQ